jgi:hypothetical protein
MASLRPTSRSVAPRATSLKTFDLALAQADGGKRKPMFGREIAHASVKAQGQHGQQRLFLGAEGAPLAGEAHEPEAAVAPRYRHRKSFRPSVVGAFLQRLAAEERQAPVTPQFRPGERKMTSPQGIDQRITLDHPRIYIEFAKRLRPVDGVEDRPLQVRQIDFTARKSVISKVASTLRKTAEQVLGSAAARIAETVSASAAKVRGISNRLLCLPAISNIARTVLSLPAWPSDRRLPDAVRVAPSRLFSSGMTPRLHPPIQGVLAEPACATVVVTGATRAAGKFAGWHAWCQ